MGLLDLFSPSVTGGAGGLSLPASSGATGYYTFGDVITGGGSKSNPFNIPSVPHMVLYAGLAVFGIAVIHKIWRHK